MSDAAVNADSLAARAAEVRRAGDLPPPSPCASICRMNAASGFCSGCLRTIEEITAWRGMDDTSRRRVWRAIELRAAAGFHTVGSDPP